MNPNYTGINAQQEFNDPDSVYRYFAQMIKLHKHTPALVYGDYKDVNPQNPSIFAFTRILGADKYLVVLNFSEKPIRYTLPNGIKTQTLAIANGKGPPEEHAMVLNLKGWDTRIYTYRQ